MSFKPNLEQIKDEIEKHLQPSDPWEYIPWRENFIAWVGPLDGLVDREDVVPESSFIEELNRRGYITSYQYQGSSLIKALDSGFRIVYLTDKKSWKRKYALENSPLTVKKASQS